MPTYLYKAHPESAHLSKLIHCLKAMVHRLSQELSKLLIVENFQTAATGDFADCGGMEAVVVVAVPTLHEDAAVAQTFCVHLPSNVVEMDTCEEKVGKFTLCLCESVFMLCLHRDRLLFKEINLNYISEYHLSIFTFLFHQQAS